MWRCALFGLAAATAVWSVGAAGQDTASAETFVRNLYAQYQSKGKPPDFSGPKAHQIFDPSLIDLVDRDRKALQGEVGVISADPICACQDYDIKSVSVSVRSIGEGKASAVASFLNLGRRTSVKFDLVTGPGGWRIYDIGEDGIDSLRASLTDEIAAASEK
jgi:hypothetical protein